MSRDNVFRNEQPPETAQTRFTSVSRLLRLTSQRRWLVLLSIVETLLVGAVVREVGRISDVSDGGGILDAETGYSHSFVVTLFDSYGQQGRDFYRNLQLWDLAHPFVYSLLLASLLFLAFRRTRWEWVALLPFAIGALDYIENAFLWVIIATYPEIDPTVVSIASVLSTFKFVSYLPTTVAAVAAIAVAVRRQVRKRHNQTIATNPDAQDRPMPAAQSDSAIWGGVGIALVGSPRPGREAFSSHPRSLLNSRTRRMG